jgi:hypothetical protein
VKGCNVQKCRNHHVCIYCKGEHSRLNCPNQAKNEMAGSQKNGTLTSKKI